MIAQGVGALRPRDMITRHANQLVDDWINRRTDADMAGELHRRHRIFPATALSTQCSKVESVTL